MAATLPHRFREVLGKSATADETAQMAKTQWLIDQIIWEEARKLNKTRIYCQVTWDKLDEIVRVLKLEDKLEPREWAPQQPSDDVNEPCRWLFHTLIGNEFLGPGEISHVLGIGASGVVFLCEFATLASKRAVKCGTISTREVENQSYAALIGLAPRCGPLQAKYYGGRKLVDVIFMDPLENTLSGYLSTNVVSAAQRKRQYQAVFEIVDVLEAHSMTHGDMHLGNVAYWAEINESKQLEFHVVLIDFGFSEMGASCRLLELVQLFRSGQLMWDKYRMRYRKALEEDLSVDEAVRWSNQYLKMRRQCREWSNVMWSQMWIHYPNTCQLILGGSMGETARNNVGKLTDILGDKLAMLRYIVRDKADQARKEGTKIKLDDDQLFPAAFDYMSVQ